MRETDQLLLISKNGQVIRIDVASVRRMGRPTEGVRLMDTADDDVVCGLAAVDEPDESIAPEGTEPEPAPEEPPTAEQTTDAAADTEAPPAE